MCPRSKRSKRCGAVLAEAAFVLPIFLTLCLGMVDLGISVFQNNAIAEASRQGARIASVHGAMAPSGWNGGPWGPTAYTGAGNATDTIPTTFRNAGVMAGLRTANVTVSVQWPDAGNSVLNSNRVQVTMSTNWTPVISYVFGSQTVTLSATSIAPIAH